jgi:magnesium-transporting ATPase (P-type)
LTSFILAFFGSICLNSTFIPISLLVAIELVKVTQAWFLTVDVEMCSAQEDGKL